MGVSIFSIGFSHCSDSVIFVFVFHFIIYNNKTLPTLSLESSPVFGGRRRRKVGLLQDEKGLVLLLKHVVIRHDMVIATTVDIFLHYSCIFAFIVEPFSRPEYT
jgi:hypothetical protein